ncbi:MAG: hypothetical protein NTW17_00855 [Candidatus Pacearchaeota archaeon]|nr:hypothetical protein [Candidatus Pacearchaeota archaeon]
MPKPKKEKKAESQKISEKEFETKVIDLSKSMTSEKIGEALRKQGIHPKEYRKISRILKEKGLYINPDVKNMEEKLKKITIHKEKNIQDKRARRERERIFSLLRKQKAYHKIA